MSIEEENAMLVDLLARIANGDERAFEQFYKSQADRVYHFLLVRLKNPTAASEVLNEVMMEVWRTGERFEGRSKVSTWLFGIAHHRMVDYLRRTTRHQGEELDETIADADAPSASRLVSIVQESDFLRRCLDKLSEAQKRVMHLAFFEDLSYLEIAEILGCPQGTVKTRVFHARLALKRCLAAFGVSI